VINLDNQIKQHFEDEYPREGCGVIALHKGKRIWVKCTNIDKEQDSFTICPKEYRAIEKLYDILAIVHSHVNSPATPSPRDIISCNAIGIPYIIYSYPSMAKEVLSPTNTSYTLIGREYEFGKADCLSLCMEYFKSTFGADFGPRIEYKDDWWLEGEDYITEACLKSWGFYPVDNYKKHDLIVLAVDHKINNHLGVVVGNNDTFLHHAVNRLSCRENLFPFWAKHITRVYRYET